MAKPTKQELLLQEKEEREFLIKEIERLLSEFNETVIFPENAVSSSEIFTPKKTRKGVRVPILYRYNNFSWSGRGIVPNWLIYLIQETKGMGTASEIREKIKKKDKKVMDLLKKYLEIS